MDFNALAQECAPWVAPQTMAAIVKTESAFRPLAINVNGKAQLTRQPKTKGEAIATAKWLIANGYNIDLGLGQVNSANLKKTSLTVEDAFEPCKNIAAAATILHWNYKAAIRKTPNEQAALHAALSAYNTGSFHRGFANGYVQKVVNNAGIKGGIQVAGTPPGTYTAGAKQAPQAAVLLRAVATTQPTQPKQSVDVYSERHAAIMVY